VGEFLVFQWWAIFSGDGRRVDLTTEFSMIDFLNHLDLVFLLGFGKFEMTSLNSAINR
jgi:hypothetical protein